MKSRDVHSLVISVCLLLLTFLLWTPALAESETGLRAFRDIYSYSEGTFSDVPQDSWFAGGVRTVYNKGIMNGVDQERFAPGDTVTWAQAVTIAARLHAACHGNTVPHAAGEWYQSYLDYTGRTGLLPDTCPEPQELGTAEITRQELAALFRRVVSEDELPAVNDARPADMEQISTRFRTAVTDMYASGIFTGKEGGKFDPEGRITRAETATIITRLLCPAQRVSADHRIDPAMAAQTGTFLSGGGIAVTDGAVTYYIVSERHGVEETYSSDCTIVARGDDGSLREIYSCDENLGHLSVDAGGKLYVIAGQSTLLRIDPVSGAAESLYRSPTWLRVYTIYDGSIYIYEEAKTSTDSYNSLFRIGKLKQGRAEVLMDSIRWSAGLYIDDSLYCFNNKLYFLYGDKQIGSGMPEFYHYSLWSIDLDSGSREKVIDGADNQALFLNTVAYGGATIWFLGADAKEEHWFLRRASLVLPELVETVCELSEEEKKTHITLYANDGALYYQASGALKLWQVTPSGSFLELSSVSTPYVEYSTVTRQGIVLHALSNVYQLYNEQIEVSLPDGTRTNYLTFLGRPWLVRGTGILQAAYRERRWDAPAAAVGEVVVDITREYRTVDGDYAAELVVVNGLDTEAALGRIILDFTGEGVSLNRSFILGETLSAGARASYTFSVPAQILGSVADREDFTLSFTIYYSNP